MNLIWGIVWLAVMFALILGAYIYAEQGISKTLNTLRVKMDLRNGLGHPKLWTLKVLDDGSVEHDSRGQLTGSKNPNIETIRERALLGKVTGDIELNDVLYVYSAERVDEKSTMMQFVAYNDI